MVSESTISLPTLNGKVAHFAATEVACRADLFGPGGKFPLDLWRNMGREGLLSLNLPRSLGGLECDPPGTMAAVEAFVRHGQSIGLAFSWLIHLLISRHFLMDFGNEEQRRRYVPSLAAGKMTASVAISEPGAGSHPKPLKTFARREDNGCFILNGEKSFLTNGPLADLFIVLAITSIQDGRKGFSAFLVERNTPGLSLTPEMDLNCLYPALHCGLMLERCRIPASSILGTEHFAYEQMAKPFRTLEDLHMTGLALGGMELQLDMLVDHIKTKESPSCDVKCSLGELRTLLDGSRVVARAIGKLSGEAGIKSTELLSLLLAFRHLSNHYQARFDQVRRGSEGLKSELLSAITRDLTHMAGIAKNVATLQQRKIGGSLLSGKESNGKFQQ